MQYDIARCERQLAIKGWTKAALARKTRLSKAVITKFFRGESVRNDTAKAIIAKLGFNVEEVIVQTVTVADLPAPLTGDAQKELLESARSRRA